MDGLGVLALSAALLLQTPAPQPQPQPTVTLILRDEDRVVTVAEAERLLKSPDLSLRVAATLALGTLPDENPIVCYGTRCHGRRLPAQAIP